MKKVTLAVLSTLIFCLICACGNSQLNNEKPSESPSNENFNQQTNEPIKPSPSPTTTITTYDEREEEEAKLREKKKRKGKIDLTNIEIIGVKGDLLKTILLMFKAIETNEDQERLKYMYHPEFDEFKSSGPYILGVTKLELDNSRLKAVIDEYSLNEIADDVAIVKITMERLNDNLEVSSSTGDYIFIHVDKNWKLYRFQ
ncbi:hypothetical protein RB620_12250 [Paenibacillus sp. LHD-117]|uniref:hypothetical protein n=1 Tax=Paenibacillus sp. LHD-117 TaxID=3071412 RepID=UPI0027DF7943|nr:hypothetical protein [Paenibacillus sp. LHD-117]MDQ6420208.1 hypothetical protein [Paenibacillus sp. LHD-117]